MKTVHVLAISEQTLVSTGESQAVLVLSREDGNTFHLPLRMDEEELGALIEFLFRQADNYDVSRSDVREDSRIGPSLLPEGPVPYLSQEDYVEGEEDEYGDFRGGEGIDQF